MSAMPTITFYTTQHCPFCRNAELLLQRKGVTQLDKIWVDQNSQQRTVMMERTGRRTVPQIFIGEIYIGGYSELVALDRAGKLDVLLTNN